MSSVGARTLLVLVRAASDSGEVLGWMLARRAGTTRTQRSTQPSSRAAELSGGPHAVAVSTVGAEPAAAAGAAVVRGARGRGPR